MPDCIPNVVGRFFRNINDSPIRVAVIWRAMENILYACANFANEWAKCGIIVLARFRIVDLARDVVEVFVARTTPAISRVV